MGTLSNPYSIYGALKVRNKADFLENIADLLMMYANTFIVLLMQPAACAYFYVTCLWFFKLCNCAQKNCFAGPGWPANNDLLATADRQIDVAQHVELVEPLVDAAQFDDCVPGLRCRCRHRLRPLLRSRSTRSLYFDIEKQANKYRTKMKM